MEQTVLTSIKSFLFHNLNKMNCWFKTKITPSEIECSSIQHFPKETKINVFEVSSYFFIEWMNHCISLFGLIPYQK